MRLEPIENTDDQEWFWCLDHHRAEPSDASCPALLRVGPYESKSAAEHWQERVELRNQAWERDDARWDAQPGTPSDR